MEDSDNYDTTIMSDQTPTTHLEPRVAKLEAGLDILTRNVTDLTAAVRDNANNLEGKFERLTIAVTQAQAPKKTDWSTIFAGIMLVLAIGSAVFWPLNQVSQDNKARLEQYHSEIVEHQRLDNHPVGAALVQRIEGQLRDHVENNQKEFKAHVEQDEKELSELRAQEGREHTAIRTRFSEELAMQKELTEAKLKLVESEAKGTQKYNELYIDKLFGRVQSLEAERIKTADNEHAELMQWRQKAVGLTSPDSVVPLVSRENMFGKPPGPPPPPFPPQK